MNQEGPKPAFRFLPRAGLTSSFDSTGLHGRALKTALTYAVLGTMWILVSDQAVGWIFDNPANLIVAQTIKGMSYIGVTSLLVFWLARRAVRQTQAAILQEQLQSTEDLLKATLGSIGDAVLLIDPSTRNILHCNLAAERVFGFASSELVGKSTQVLHVSKQAFDEFGHLSESFLERGQVFQARAHMKRKDGELIATDHTVSTIREDAGWRDGVISIIRDITESEERQKALQKSETQYRLLADNSLDLIWAMDMNCAFTYVNPAIQTLTGYTAEEFIGTSLKDHYDSETFARLDKLIEEEVNKGPDHDGVVVTADLIRKDKSVVVTETRGRVLYNDSGNPMGLQGSTRDITERKKAERRRDVLLQRITSLHRIDQAVSSLSPVDVVLQQVVSAGMDTLEVDAAAILLLRKPQNELEYWAQIGFQTSQPKAIALQLGQGYAGACAMERRTANISDIQAEDLPASLSEMVRLEGFRGYACSPIIGRGRLLGLIEVYRFEATPLDPDQLGFLETLAGHAANGIDNISSFEKLEIANERLHLAYDSCIEGWARSLEYRDHETERHSRRVTEITLTLAQRLGFDESVLQYVRWGALLHDIGKIGVPDHILRKSGKLNEKEWEIVKQHPVIARDILSPIAFLTPAIDIPYYHHERWDGSGYPRGLQGEDIPLTARIFAVADVWDALRADRPYRKGWPQQKVLDYLAEKSGTQFDPKVVEVFLQCLWEIPACSESNYE